MGKREYYYRWVWPLKSSPDALWPLVADTNRFNRDGRVPAIEQLPGLDVNESRGGHRLRMQRFKLLGRGFVPIEWDEEPFEWVRPYRFGVVRRYRNAPVETMKTRVELQPRAGGGTTAIYEVWVTPANLLGVVGTPIQVGVQSARYFRQAFYHYDRLAQAGRLPPDEPARGDFPPGGRERLRALRNTLRAKSKHSGLVDRLVDIVEHGDDMTLARLRPYVLADYWGVSRRAMLEVCLQATRAGLLDFRWDVLCPLCRGSRESGESLGAVDSSVHCDTCNIDFNVNFDRSVELTFRPNAAVRAVEVQDFCIAGPMVTPHVALQQKLADGEERVVRPALEPGRYRLRTLNLPGGQYLKIEPDGLGEIEFQADASGWPNEEPLVGLTPSLRLINRAGSEQLFILEHMAWSDQAATAAEVTAMQMFRDLFANEALRPGERISVGSLTVLFTDLRGSTRLYREIGDAPAFGLVMDHFDILREAINAEDGAIVKTIGDAVMATFRRPVHAVRAILHAQRALSETTRQPQALALKAGIHTGPSIAVTLNDRLDYFGTTVNLAARLEGLSSGSDIIVTRDIYMDPEVTAFLKDCDQNLTTEPFEATLKGFDTERFDLWRIIPPLVGMPATPTLEPAEKRTL